MKRPPLQPLGFRNAPHHRTKMTRQHFQSIASIINSHMIDARNDFNENLVNMCQSIAYDMADFLQTTNPAFDRSRFLDACGVSE